MRRNCVNMYKGVESWRYTSNDLQLNKMLKNLLTALFVLRFVYAIRLYNLTAVSVDIALTSFSCR